MAERRGPEPVDPLERRTDRLQFLICLITMLIGMVGGWTVFANLDRIGSTDGPEVIASGTATVHSCTHQSIGAAYNCAASMVWHDDRRYRRNPPANVTVRSLRPLT